MSRSIRDLRELICLSRFGFRPDESEIEQTNHQNQSDQTILLYFDPSTLNNWLELTSTRLEKLRSLTINYFIDFIYFWLKQFDFEHKQSLFKMEFELFHEHLLLSFTPNDVDSLQINQFARQILHDIDQQIGLYSIENDYQFINYIDIFSRFKRDNQYRTLLANLPIELTKNVNNRSHLQWMLAIRAFGLISICMAAVEFFEKVQKTLEQNRSKNETFSHKNDEQTVSNDSTDQIKNRIFAALRKDYVEVIEYFIKTNQLTGDSLDEQNRNILFHAIPLGNISMIELLLKSKLSNFDINSCAVSGNSLLHQCVSLQRPDFVELLIKYYPNINLNQRNKQDATALHLAIIYDDFEMIRFLIKLSIDTKLTMKGKTCLQIATELNHKQLVEYFSKLV